MEKRIFLASPHMSDEGYEREFVKEAFDTNWIAPLGENVNKFEEELANYVETKARAQYYVWQSVQRHCDLCDPFVPVGTNPDVVHRCGYSCGGQLCRQHCGGVHWRGKSGDQLAG